MADQLDREAKRPSTEGEPTRAPAQELRVVAQLVRDEAVGREEREATREKVAENLSLEAQG
jgi:hypothetical protein